MNVEDANAKGAVDSAWKIHAAQADWTAKVDVKASFALTLETAAIATVVALSAPGRLYSSLQGPTVVGLYWIGLALLGIAAFFAIIVVTPRLKSEAARKSYPDNYIYFGHVRHWEAEELAKTLREGDILPVLTRQITVMGDIAWQKHEWVQRSLFLGGIGGACLIICGVAQRTW